MSNPLPGARKPAARTRGLTLLEALVALSLTALIAVVVVSFLIPSLRRTAAGARKAALQSDATACLERISRELQTTGSAGLSLAPSAVGLVPIVGTTPLGTLVWSDRMHLFFFSNGTVLRKVVDEGLAFDPSRPPRLGPDELEALCTPEGATRLASHVESFTTNQALDPLQLHITVAEADQRFKYSRAVSLRNP